MHLAKRVFVCELTRQTSHMNMHETERETCRGEDEMLYEK